MRVLVTGAAGFIGFHTSLFLCNRGDETIGIDNLNSYYNPQLKQDRLSLLADKDGFSFRKGDLSDASFIEKIFKEHKPEKVIHLAAQAGVRYSLENPRSYIDSNIVGFLNVIEGCRHHAVKHLVFASSSSVYGANEKTPYSIEDNVDHPISLYAATKKSNELMAFTYAHLFGIPTTGLRFFTVYGPWGRPDMTPYVFVDKILKGESINIYNMGNHKRDFTYIDDIVEGIILALDNSPGPKKTYQNSREEDAPYRLYNIGHNKPVALMDYIACIEHALGTVAEKKYLPKQPGDVLQTWADIDSIVNDLGFNPKTPLQEGIESFVKWYKDYHNYR